MSVMSLKFKPCNYSFSSKERPAVNTIAVPSIELVNTSISFRIKTKNHAVQEHIILHVIKMCSLISLSSMIFNNKSNLSKILIYDAYFPKRCHRTFLETATATTCTFFKYLEIKVFQTYSLSS